MTFRQVGDGTALLLFTVGSVQQCLCALTVLLMTHLGLGGVLMGAGFCNGQEDQHYWQSEIMVSGNRP